MTVIVAQSGDGLSVAFDYSRDLFDAATARRMTGHYMELLALLARARAVLDRYMFEQDGEVMRDDVGTIVRSEQSAI